jgi:hypothetical protein
MSEDRSGRKKLTLESVHVGTADAAVGHVDHHLTRPGSGLVPVDHLEMAIAS